MNIQREDSIIEQFNGMPWHDSKLLNLSFYRSGGEEQVKISLELRDESGATTRSELLFRDSVYIEADVYLGAKRMCSDDIEDAECKVSSDWKRGVSEPSPHDVIRNGRHFEDYLHFRISLCSPGGTIDILAMGFLLASPAHGEQASADR